MFGKRPTAKQRSRQQRRSLRRSQRDLEREYKRLEREERKLIGDIKKAVRQNDRSTATILSKSLVRLRGQQAKLKRAASHVSGVSTRMATTQATHTMVDAMAGSARVMQATNASMNPGRVQATAGAFARASAEMDMRQEMMDDAFDDMDAVSDEDEADAVLRQVLDGVALDATAGMVSAPTSRVGVASSTAATTTATATSDADLDRQADELMARLEAL